MIARGACSKASLVVALVVDPEAAHGVVDCGEDLHRVVIGIDAREFLVDLEDTGELLPQERFALVREIEIDLVLVATRLVVEDAALLVEADLEDGARCDVARHQVSVAGVHALQEVVAVLVGNPGRSALILRVLGHPDASPLAARALADETQLVGARDGGRVDLDELAVGVDGSLLPRLPRGEAGADDAVGGAPEDHAGTAGREAHRVEGERLNLHGLQILRDHPHARAVVVDHQGDEVPVLELADHSLADEGRADIVDEVDGLVASHLLVEGVEELLAGGGAGEGGAMEQRSAEASEVEQAFRGTIEGDAHAVEQVDDPRGGVGHALDGGLIGEEVAAVGGFLEVDAGAVALALGVDGGVDAALGADGVAASDGDEREEIDGDACFAELDGGHQAGEAAADDGDASDVSPFTADRFLGSHGMGVSFRGRRVWSLGRGWRKG